MKSNPSSDFTGFSPETLRFFLRLEKNNNREWFGKHKDEYLRDVAEPMKRLVVSLGPVMESLDPKVSTAPGRTMSRIYRDTRFSHDKTPYRPRLWFAFKRNVEHWSETPTFFFEVTKDNYSFGAGTFRATPATMRRFRELIDLDPDAFLEIVKPINRSKTFFMESEKYKRPLLHTHPKGVDPWYQSKSIAVVGNREPDKTLFSAKLVDFLTERFLQLKPLYEFLWDATVY